MGAGSPCKGPGVNGWHCDHGRHTYSLDGKTWYGSATAAYAEGTLLHSNGTTQKCSISQRQRPKLVLSADEHKLPLFLYTQAMGGNCTTMNLAVDPATQTSRCVGHTGAWPGRRFPHNCDWGYAAGQATAAVASGVGPPGSPHPRASSLLRPALGPGEAGS